MGSAVTTFVEQHGVWAVFLLMLVESCGVPFPSEVTMPVAGALAAGALGGAHMGMPGAILAGTLGNLVGSLVAYGLAARWGEPLLLGPGRYIGIRRSHLESADRWFERHGLVAVFVGRLLPVVRTYISFPAGLARVDLPRFSILTVLGALPWCAALAAAGYAVGSSYDRVSHPIEIAALVIAALVVLLVVAWFVRGRRQPGRSGSRVA